MESTTDAWFAPDGTPFRFTHHRVEGQERRSVEGYRDGAEMVIRQDVGGNLRERRVPAAGLRFASSLEILYGGGQLSEKTAPLSGKALDESDAEVKDFSLKVTGSETRDGQKLLVLEEELGKVKSRSLVRPDGEVLETALVGIGAVFVKTTKEAAVAATETVDIFSSAMFQVPKPLPPSHDLDRLVVRLTGKSGKAPAYLTDRRQTAKPAGPASVELTLGVDAAPKKAAKRPVTDPKVKVFLKETPYEPLSDERLVAVVERVTAGAPDVWSAAKAINRFVHKHISNKSLARAFATATEALESREGDCTEHAVLFSALAKIAGIPTKLVTGLVYVGGRTPVFGYHEWVEVWTGSGWVAMDPTFGQDLADATHIKFTEGQSDADGLREAGMAAAALIGDLELKVVEYTTTSGKTVRP